MPKVQCWVCRQAVQDHKCDHCGAGVDQGPTKQFWLSEKEYRPMLEGATRIQDSDKLPPFIADYIRESIFKLPNGDELHVYFQDFGYLRGAKLVKAG